MPFEKQFIFLDHFPFSKHLLNVLSHTSHLKMFLDINKSKNVSLLVFF